MTGVNESLSMKMPISGIDGIPVLYSFRRCPYAMRARLAISAADIPVELREVVLREKPPEFLEASPKGTVPVLVLQDGTVLEESLDIMKWATGLNDAEGWLRLGDERLEETWELISNSDGPFKVSLDRYKYPNRYENVDPQTEREQGANYIRLLDNTLGRQHFLFGEKFTFADAAILPFVRQFAHVDRNWFFNQEWDNVKRWLSEFLEGERFQMIMDKYPQWKAGDAPLVFGKRPYSS